MGDPLFGTIICENMEQLPNGDWKVIFNYDRKFKEQYKKMFNLKRWSRKHFELKLDEAIQNLAKKIEQDKKCLDLK